MNARSGWLSYSKQAGVKPDRSANGFLNASKVVSTPSLIAMEGTRMMNFEPVALEKLVDGAEINQRLPGAGFHFDANVVVR